MYGGIGWERYSTEGVFFGLDLAGCKVLIIKDIVHNHGIRYV